MVNPVSVAWEVSTLSHLQKLILVAVASFGTQSEPETDKEGQILFEFRRTKSLPRNIPYQFDPETIASKCGCTISRVRQELERLDEEGICKITSPRSGVFPFGKE